MRRIRSPSSDSGIWYSALRTRLARFSPLSPISSAGVSMARAAREGVTKVVGAVWTRPPPVARESWSEGRPGASPRRISPEGGGRGPMRVRAAYDELIRRVRQASLLSSCAELLGWDEETYMPRAGAAHRAEQLALLAGMLHQRNTDPRLGELLDVLEGSDLVRDPEAPEAVNVRELRRVHSRAVRLPRAL